METLRDIRRVAEVDGLVVASGYLVQDLVEKYENIVAVDPEIAEIYMEYAIDSPWFKLLEITSRDELLAELIEARYIVDTQEKPLLLLCGERPRECYYLVLLYLLRKKPLGEASSYADSILRKVFPNYEHQNYLVDEIRVVEDLNKHLGKEKLYLLYSLSANYRYGISREHLSKTLYFAYKLRSYSSNLPLLYTLIFLHTLLEDKSGENPAKIYNYRREFIESAITEIDPQNHREIRKSLEKISKRTVESREEAATLLACILALSTVEEIDTQGDKLLISSCRDAKKCLGQAKTLGELARILGFSKITYTEEAISGD